MLDNLMRHFKIVRSNILIFALCLIATALPLLFAAIGWSEFHYASLLAVAVISVWAYNFEFYLIERSHLLLGVKPGDKFQHPRYAATICLLLLVLLAMTACMPNYSEGSRVGVVNKLSQKGLVFKSWEGEANMGGMRTSTDSDGNSAMAPNVFPFNVDPSQVEAVKAALESGKPVKMTYRQWAISPPSISNDTVIVAVEPVE